MNKTIQVVCGSHNIGDRKLVWALSLLDMRVYVRDEGTHIDTLADELDDFIGYEPKGYEWEFKVVDGSSKRVSAWVNRTQALIKKQKETSNE